MLGTEPAFVGDDLAVFGGGVEVGLSSLPWVRPPWCSGRSRTSRRPTAASSPEAQPLGEVADGSLAELGTAEVTNGDPATGIVDVPGGRLAVLRAADGDLVGLTS